MKKGEIKITSYFKKYKKDLLFAFFIIVLITLIVVGRDYSEFFNSRESFEEFISSFGFLGPLVAILVIILEVVIAPIPGFVISLSAGFLFGSIKGSFCVYLGNVIGTVFVFIFARKLGKHVVKRFFKEGKIIKYEKIISKNENILLLLYFFPVIPVDVISVAFGLSRTRFKKFLRVILIAYIPYAIVMTNFGDQLARWFFDF